MAVMNPVGPGSRYYYESSDSGLESGINGIDRSASTSVGASVSSIPTFCGSVTVLRQPKPKTPCGRVKKKLGLDCKISWVDLGKFLAALVGIVFAAVLGVVIGYYAMDPIESYTFILNQTNGIQHVEGAFINKDMVRFYTPSHDVINQVETVVDFTSKYITNIDHSTGKCFIEPFTIEQMGSIENVRLALQHIKQKQSNYLTQNDPSVNKDRQAVPWTPPGGAKIFGEYAARKCSEKKYPFYETIRDSQTNQDSFGCGRSCYPHFSISSDTDVTPVIHHLQIAYIECVTFPPCNISSTTTSP